MMLQTEIKNDSVNHPSHYADNCSIECIDAMQLAFGSEPTMQHCMINCFKYLWRYKDKNGMGDLQKAEWYVRRATDLVEIVEPTSDWYDKCATLRGLVKQHMEKCKAGVDAPHRGVTQWLVYTALTRGIRVRFPAPLQGGDE